MTLSFTKEARRDAWYEVVWDNDEVGCAINGVVCQNILGRLGVVQGSLSVVTVGGSTRGVVGRRVRSRESVVVGCRRQGGQKRK